MNKTRELILSIFKSYHSELKAEIDKANSLLKIKRIYDSGQVLEIAVTEVLARNLPDWVGYTRGVIIDTNANCISEEIDIILYDKRYFPGLVISKEGSESISCISIDVLLGVISVKKKLTRKSLKDAIKNIKSVTDLSRKAIPNQFHYDLNLGDTIIYKDGKDMGGFFSCIISYENDLFYREKNKKRVRRTPPEIIKYFDELCSEEWFDGTTVDHIYTVDGTVFFPLKLEGDKWTKTNDIGMLSSQKKTIRPFIDENNTIQAGSNYCLSYSYNFESPEISLGNLVGFLQVYCAQLVKSSPKIHKWFDEFQKLDIETPMSSRNIEDIKRL